MEDHSGKSVEYSMLGNKFYWPLGVGCGSVLIYLICMGLLVPGIQGARYRAANVQTMMNLSQVAFAHHRFHDMFKRFPPAEGGAVLIDDRFHGSNVTNLFLVGPFMNMNAEWLVAPADYSLEKTQNSWTSGKCYTSIASNLYVFSDPVNGISGSNTPIALGDLPHGAFNTIMFTTTMAQCGGNPVYIQNSTVKPFFGSAQVESWQEAPPAAECKAATGTMAVSYNTSAIQICMCDTSVLNFYRPGMWGSLLKPYGPNQIGWYW